MRSICSRGGMAILLAGLMLFAACKAGPEEAAVEWEPPQGFPIEIYAAPQPTLAAGGALLAGCPNPAGLEAIGRIDEETALALLEDLYAADMYQAQQAADPALWPRLDDMARPGSPQPGWLDGKAIPASQSPYAAPLARQCGEGVLALSWTFTVCDEGCLQSGSESLKQDFFLLSRGGRLLVWAVWP